jgi:4-diphosphocytidyl-2-C-methyl-D-erythritol kinase
MVNFPNAKINLGLYIKTKRPDGFHELESCFYPVGWTDALEILEAPELKFESSGIEIPGNTADNLCLKAYYLLAKDYDLPPVHIHLHKVVPIGAGMGGGSADAAFTIRMLNESFALGLSVEQMQRYARQLGSDCAFFIENKPVIAYGKGDEFMPLEVPKLKGYIVIVYPQIHISTKEAYAGVKPAAPKFNLNELILSGIENWKDNLKNDFEDSLFPSYPVLPAIKNKLYEKGAIYASMTGSGSAVYGIFKEAPVWGGWFPEEYQIWSGRL